MGQPKSGEKIFFNFLHNQIYMYQILFCCQILLQLKYNFITNDFQENRDLAGCWQQSKAVQ